MEAIAITRDSGTLGVYSPGREAARVDNAMLKSDLIAVLVQKRNITQKQAEQTVETIFEAMKSALCKGENIEIRGLGAFHVKHYQGYQGRNPKTGEVIPVKPKRGILFRTGKELRDRVNQLAQAKKDGDAGGNTATGS